MPILPYTAECITDHRTWIFSEACYILSTSVYTRQHDVDTFGGDYGHAGYIEYLLFNRRLPDFDVRERWQFCHPPLHHIISAVWIEINENILLTGHDPARESLQRVPMILTDRLTAKRMKPIPGLPHLSVQ